MSFWAEWEGGELELELFGGGLAVAVAQPFPEPKVPASPGPLSLLSGSRFLPFPPPSETLSFIIQPDH